MGDFAKTTWRAILAAGRLTGPIFGKELRVSSRRSRSYALRVFYVALLTVFVAIVWLGVVEYQGSAAVQQARMAAAGKQIVTTVVVFQFVAMQLLAIIMLSTAISDELYHRTLGLLMTTPVSSLQIVMGKVLSRLLQLILLLVISLPILAIVRVFGGVAWGYLLSSLCITLTAALFAGAVSLLLSVENRNAYGVIVRAAFVLLSLYVALPGVTAALGGPMMMAGMPIRPTPRMGMTLSPSLGVLLAHANPLYALWATTLQMQAPGAGRLFYWPLHCGMMLGGSALVLSWAVARVRKVALRQATGQLVGWELGRRPRGRRAGLAEGGPLKRVHGLPVVWRELRAPFIQGVDSRNSYIGLTLVLVTLAGIYTILATQRLLDQDFTHIMFALLFVFIGAVVNVVFAATRITTEKESQSWLLLLTTPLSDGEILFGKAISVFRRCLPIWGLLAGHMVLFVLVGYIHPVSLVQLAMVVGWLTCFITAVGLYFSARFARTTSAVVACFAVFLGLWALGPIIAGLLGLMSRQGEWFHGYMSFHPAIQTHVLMAGTAGRANAEMSWRGLTYGAQEVMFYVGHGTCGVGRMTATLAAIAAVYILVSLLFFWRAKCRLRRHALR
jgi:ABC-type transport system involved in multi-copper enzyme maturation permease subunit